MIWIPKNLGTVNSFFKKPLQLHKDRRVYLSHLPQSFALFAVDMSLHAGLAPADEYEVPQGESSKRHCYRAVGDTNSHLYLFNQKTFRAHALGVLEQGTEPRNAQIGPCNELATLPRTLPVTQKGTNWSRKRKQVGTMRTWSAPRGRWHTCERWSHWRCRWGRGCDSNSGRDGKMPIF